MYKVKVVYRHLKSHQYELYMCVYVCGFVCMHMCVDASVHSCIYVCMCVEGQCQISSSIVLALFFFETGYLNEPGVD